jgi:hypothetical protein
MANSWPRHACEGFLRSPEDLPQVGWQGGTGRRVTRAGGSLASNIANENRLNLLRNCSRQFAVISGSRSPESPPG